jgi:hypothetical protein
LEKSDQPRVNRLEFGPCHADNDSMEKRTPAHSTVLRRALATVGCVLAFAVMSSIFSPDRTRAGGIIDQWPGIPPKSVEYAPHHANEASSSASSPAHDAQRAASVDPHEGLQSLGTIEDRGYFVHIYATESGPRYTIYEKATGIECGALLTEKQVHQAYPDLQLPTMEFNGESPLMLVDPSSELWW